MTNVMQVMRYITLNIHTYTHTQYQQQQYWKV